MSVPSLRSGCKGRAGSGKRHDTQQIRVASLPIVLVEYDRDMQEHVSMKATITAQPCGGCGQGIRSAGAYACTGKKVAELGDIDRIALGDLSQLLWLQHTYSISHALPSTFA